MLKADTINPQSFISFLKKPRNTILSLLLLAFFLPWISYGFIIKSGFDLPLYSEHLKSIIGFFTQGRFELPEEIIYIYLLYLYPALIILLFFIQSRVLELFTGLLPVVPFFVALYILPIDIVPYIGYGFFILLGASLALIIESLFFREKSFNMINDGTK